MAAVNWISSRTVISRITRNRKDIPAEYLEDLEEWIGEALRKMKTINSVEIRSIPTKVRGHRASVPKMEGILCVEYNGHKLGHATHDGSAPRDNCYGTVCDSLFQSIVPIYTTAGDLVDLQDGRSKFPRDIIVRLDCLEYCNDWYRVNYNVLETSIESGEIVIWYTALPKGEDGLPLIPDTEAYGEAIYRYCRMMLIESGLEDKVISHGDAVQLWNIHCDRAISSVTFPTMDEVRDRLMREGLIG